MAGYKDTRAALRSDCCDAWWEVGLAWRKLGSGGGWRRAGPPRPRRRRLSRDRCFWRRGRVGLSADRTRPEVMKPLLDAHQFHAAVLLPALLVGVVGDRLIRAEAAWHEPVRLHAVEAQRRGHRLRPLEG